MPAVVRDRSPRIRSLPASRAGSSFGPLSRTARPAEPSVAPARVRASAGASEPRHRDPKLRSLAVLLALVAAGGFAARHRPTPPKPEFVSGRAEPRRTALGVAERWRDRDVHVILDGSLESKRVDAREIVMKAFGAWLSSVPDLPRLSFDSRPAGPVRLEPDGENRIYFAPITVAGHEGDLGLTIAYADPETGDILETDVIIDSGTKLTTDRDGDGGESTAQRSRTSGGRSEGSSCNGGYDLESIVTHEIGHFFGLSEDLGNQNATMYFSTTPCETRQRQVTVVDALEMTKLYAPTSEASSAAEPIPAGGPSCAVARGVPATPGVAWFFPAAALAVARRLRRSSNRRRPR